MQKVSIIGYQFPCDKPKNVKTEYTWYYRLKKESGELLVKDPEAMCIEGYAPLGAFNEIPLRGELIKITRGTLIEVELTEKDKHKTENLDSSVKPVWIAEVLHMAGYYILARWVGASKADGTFWIHSANALIHPVGFTEKRKSQNYFMVPPASIFDQKSITDWTDYLLNRIFQRYTLCDSYDLRGTSMLYNKFKINDRVEVIHDEESSNLVPAIVKKIHGRRVLLEYSKNDIDKENYFDKENLWKDMSDDLIFYVGFAAYQGLNLIANKKYKEHTEKIAQALKDGIEPSYARLDVTKGKICEWKEGDDNAKWDKNMVLEILDRLDSMLSILKPARVLRVLKDGYLHMGPEGKDIQDDSFVIHQSSPMLFPIGYANKHGLILSSPKYDNEEVQFEWDKFMKKTGYNAAPEHFFHDVTANDVPFKIGQHIEAIDQNEKVCCPATVKAIKGRLLLIGFDGWTDDFDQLYDFRSNDISPIGWAEMLGHTLQRPEQTIAKESQSEIEDDEPSKKKKK